MKILPSGIAVLQDDTHASKTVEQLGSLLYEPENMAAIASLINPGDLCVDAGAFIGGFTQAMLNSQATVIAFEPNPEAFQCLEHNCPEARCRNIGLDRTAGVHTIHTHPNAGRTYFDDNFTQTKLVYHFEPLDNFNLPRLNLLKIDVEGMEPDVLSGARHTIVAHRPVIWIEVNHAALARQGYSYIDIISILTVFGYSLSYPGPGKSLRQSDWPQLDLLFKPL